jgi:hypothetical protein
MGEVALQRLTVDRVTETRRSIERFPIERVA